MSTTRSMPAVPIAAPSAPMQFLVGQNRQGCWVAVEIHGLGGGLFRTRTDAVHYASDETRNRPDGVVVTGDLVELRV